MSHFEGLIIYIDEVIRAGTIIFATPDRDVEAKNHIHERVNTNQDSKTEQIACRGLQIYLHTSERVFMSPDLRNRQRKIIFCSANFTTCTLPIWMTASACLM